MESTEPATKSRLFAGGGHLVGPMAAAILGVFVVQLDFFAVQTAVPDMAADLDSTAADLQWVISGYMLATASCLIVGGRLADIFGRKRWLIIGAAMFGIASLLGGASTSAELVIFWRIVQGVGGAILFPVSLAVVTNAFPTGRVQRAVGLVFAVGAVSQALGPLMGGLLTDLVSWRLVLWVNVPLCLAIGIISITSVAESRDESVPRKIDWGGLVLVIASIAVFTYGIDAASEWGWTSPSTLGLIVAGLVGLAVFMAVEMRVRFPMLDLRLFRIRVFSAMSVGGAIGNIGTTIVIFLSMILLQDVEGFSPATAGAAFLSFSLGCGISAIASGHLERVPPWLVMTTALLLGGLGALGMGLSGSLVAYLVLAVVAGLGLGMSWSYTSVITQAVVPARKAGAASGTVLTILVSLGGVGLALAISLYGTHTSPGSSNEGEVIKAILTGFGILAMVTAPLIALFGRSGPPAPATQPSTS